MIIIIIIISSKVVRHAPAEDVRVGAHAHDVAAEVDRVDRELAVGVVGRAAASAAAAAAAALVPLNVTNEHSRAGRLHAELGQLLEVGVDQHKAVEHAELLPGVRVRV